MKHNLKDKENKKRFKEAQTSFDEMKQVLEKFKKEPFITKNFSSEKWEHSDTHVSDLNSKIGKKLCQRFY